MYWALMKREAFAYNLGETQNLQYFLFTLWQEKENFEVLTRNISKYI